MKPGTTKRVLMGLDSIMRFTLAYVSAVSTTFLSLSEWVRMISRLSTHRVGMPMDAILVASMRLDTSSPQPCMASRLDWVSSPTRKTPLARLAIWSKVWSQTSRDSSCFSMGSRVSIILWCLSRNSSSSCTYDPSRDAARCPILMRASVKPLMAEAITMVLSLTTALAMISAHLAMLAASATEVPPNFNTCIYKSILSSFLSQTFKHRRHQPRYAVGLEQEAVVPEMRTDHMVVRTRYHRRHILHRV